MDTPGDSQLTAAKLAQGDKLPRHVAIIMDGNNRWSRQNQGAGIAGHRAGAATARRVVNHCARRGIQWLTLFVFSSENWARPRREVNGLMALFMDVLQRQEINKLHERGIRIRFIGSRERFPPKLLTQMQAAEQLTAANTGMNLVVAADYGGRWDISQAARAIAELVAAGKLHPDQVDQHLVHQHTCLAEAPPPDLCIRTGGEQRLSNFLLWQMAYTEFYFTPIFWPDFNEAEMDGALQAFQHRQRRFGGLSTEEAAPCPQSDSTGEEG